MNDLITSNGNNSGIEAISSASSSCSSSSCSSTSSSLALESNETPAVGKQLPSFKLDVDEAEWCDDNNNSDGGRRDDQLGLGKQELTQEAVDSDVNMGHEEIIDGFSFLTFQLEADLKVIYSF
jgi:hypothetical protein